MSETRMYHPPRSDEAAWAAGVFEGEGTIALRAGRGATVQLAVQMTDEDVVRRLHEVLDCGNVNGPYNKKTPAGGEAKPQWCWATGKQSDVVHVLALLLPYLGVRRKARALQALAAVAPRLVARSA